MIGIFKKYPKVTSYMMSLFFSRIGNKINAFALPLLVYNITESSFHMGVMFLFQTLPSLIIPPLVGELIAKHPLKKLIVITSIFQFLSVLLIPLLWYLNIKNMLLIYIVGSILSSLGIIASLVNQSIVAQTVEPNDFIHINSFNELTKTVALLIGPMIAGLTITYVSIYIAFVIDAITFLPIIFSVIYLPITNENIEVENKSIFEGVNKGIRYISSNKYIKPMIIFSLLINIFNGMVMALFVVYASDILKLNAGTLSFVYTVIAIVQLVIVGLPNKLVGKFNYGNIMINSQILSGIGIIIMGLSSNWILFGFGSSVNEGTTLVYNIINRSVRQKIVDKKYLGRVNGINRMIALSSFPLAGFLAGVIAEFTGVKFVILFAGIGLTILSILSSFTPIKLIDNEFEAASNRESSISAY